MHVVLRLELQAQLGEGILWVTDPQTGLGRFFSVDIHGRNIHAFDENGQGLQTWPAPERVGWVVPTLAPGQFLAGFQSGFATIRLGEALQVAQLTPAFSGRPQMRLNDACVDANGVVWAGSLNCDDESRPDGVLFRLTHDGGLSVVDQRYCVTNGPAISPDNRLFLHTDSARRTIFAFDFDAQRSAIAHKRIWKVLDESEGYPDGMCFDAAGNVWVAHWGAGLLSQFSSAAQLLQRVRLPVSNVTNMAFGGEKLDRLYLTTARAGLSAEQLLNEPLAGAVFEITGHGAVGLTSGTFGSN